MIRITPVALILLFCGVPDVLSQAENGFVAAIDSDYLHLEMKTSLLPFPVGDGVFAKFDIRSGEILYKLFNIDLPENGVLQRYYIIGEGICAFINDCADILGKVYTQAELNELATNETATLSTYPGYEYNAGNVATNLGKVFIASIKNIKAGEEIYFSYGKILASGAAELTDWKAKYCGDKREGPMKFTVVRSYFCDQ